MVDRGFDEDTTPHGAERSRRRTSDHEAYAMMKHRATLIAAASLVLVGTAYAEDEGEDDGPGFEAVELFDVDAAYQRASDLAQWGSVSRARAAFIEITEHEPEDVPTVQNIVNLSEHLEEWEDCVVWSQRLLFLTGPDDDFERKRDRCAANIPHLMGSIGITSVAPDYAPVAFNGMVLAEAATEAIALPRGTWEITTEVVDWEPFAQTVELEPEAHVDVEVELGVMTFYGTVAMSIDQPGASVVVDGEPAGTSPLPEPLRLPVGRYLVEVQKDGFYPWRRYVDIHRDVDDAVEVMLIDESVDLDDL